MCGNHSPLQSPARSVVQTRERVRLLLDTGLSRAETAVRLGIAKSTVSYHARALGRPIDERFARRYDWAQVQAYHDTGHTGRQCMAYFGFSAEAWHSARQRGDLVTRPAGMALQELLTGPRNRGHLKQRLIRLGLKQARCERCGVEDWCGAPLSLALHHINGDGDDNRLENLQLLCPNCHSQTENFAGRNRRPRYNLKAPPDVAGVGAA